ncbi:MAG: hypothetical protein O2931_06280 [Planctomycetota bacterium]|nr:hypothetical protein [Planctomycetota bacterium]
MNYPPKLVTIGRIVQEIGEPLHRVEYVLRTRHHIRPAAYAGRVRLFRKAAVAQVRHELNALDARRSERGAV